jgi:hypothetical protein
MIFEIGKYYKHTTGRMLHVLCNVETKLYGDVLLAETYGGYKEFQAVGRLEENTMNFVETEKEEWDKAWDDIQ